MDVKTCWLLKAEHTDTLPAKISSSLLIVFVFVIMAGTIKFYSKPMPWSVEVKNVRAYTLLTAKFHAASSTAFQGTPERSLCCGHVVAKSLAILFLFCGVCFSCRIVHRGFSCNNVEICGILFSYRPHPLPLPLKGGEWLRRVQSYGKQPHRSIISITNENNGNNFFHEWE